MWSINISQREELKEWDKRGKNTKAQCKDLQKVELEKYSGKNISTQ